MKTRFVQTDDQYRRGFLVDEYNGEIKLAAAREYEGKIFVTWGDIEIGKNKTKKLPVQVSLGSKSQAIGMLKRAIGIIEKMGTQKATPKTTAPEDDVPF